MTKLLKYWNQNKRKILITIAVIAFFIIMLQIVNAMIRKQNQDRKNQVSQNTAVVNDITKPNQSVISDGKLSEKETEENSSWIAQFVDYCNQQKIDQAYQFLTEDCKTELFANKEIFATNYLNQIFQEPVTYELQLWKNIDNCYTYRITYYKGNLLQTGGQVSRKNFIDYITLMKQNGEYKISVNSFIRREEIHKEGSNQGIEIAVNSKSIYVNYEIYHMLIQNNTPKTILLNDGTNVNDVCLIGKNNEVFSSVISETPISSLSLSPQYRKNIDLKFNKLYMTESKIEAMQITNIYLDKTQYDNQEQNAEKITIRVGI